MDTSPRPTPEQLQELRRDVEREAARFAGSNVLTNAHRILQVLDYVAALERENEELRK